MSTRLTASRRASEPVQAILDDLELGVALDSNVAQVAEELSERVADALRRRLEIALRRWAAAFPTDEGDGGGAAPARRQAPELLRILLGGEVFDADAGDLFDADADAAAEADIQGAADAAPSRARAHNVVGRRAWCGARAFGDGDARGVVLGAARVRRIVCEQVPPRAGHLNVAAAAADGAADDDGAPPTDLRHLMQQLPGGVVASAYCGVERALAAANERLREEWAPYETLWRDDDEASAAAGAEMGEGEEEQEEDDSGGEIARRRRRLDELISVREALRTRASGGAATMQWRHGPLTLDLQRGARERGAQGGREAR